jgi:hypothetical protein
MSRQSVRSEALRALFARSGNRCAFPGCTAKLVNEKNIFIAQVCHIRAAEPGGQRFEEAQTDDERRDYANLILLCYPHHKETDDVDLYPAAKLLAMKAAHERGLGQRPFQIDESVLHMVVAEMAEYWDRIDFLHRTLHAAPEFAVPILAGASAQQLFDQAKELIGRLWGVHAYLIESEEIAMRRDAERGVHRKPRDFEMLYIGMANFISRLAVTIDQAEIKSLEDFVKLNPTDLEARRRLNSKKQAFEQVATSAGLAD